MAEKCRENRQCVEISEGCKFSCQAAVDRMRFVVDGGQHAPGLDKLLEGPAGKSCSALLWSRSAAKCIFSPEKDTAKSNVCYI